MRFSQHFREARGIVSFSSSNGLFLMELVLNMALPLQSFGVQPQPLVLAALIQMTTERRWSLFGLHTSKVCAKATREIKRMSIVNSHWLHLHFLIWICFATSRLQDWVRRWMHLLRLHFQNGLLVSYIFPCIKENAIFWSLFKVLQIVV